MGNIQPILAQLTGHGYLLLFVWVFAEILGVPLPAAPVLLAAGALSATGRLSFEASWLAGIAACVMGDLLWYSVGRRWGSEILGRFDYIWTKHPAKYKSRAFGLITRFGSRAMLVAKFLPAINIISAPMAGIGVPVATYLAWEIPGSMAYIGAWLLAGRLLGPRIELLFPLARGATGAFLGFLMIGAATLATFRYRARRERLRLLAAARIKPEELKELITRGESPLIIDLRHPLDMLTDPRMIPGAVRLTPEELAEMQPELLQVGDVVLYCTCPNEESSAEMAHRLQAKGIQRVRPLLGGFALWRRLGYPLEEAPDQIHWHGAAQAISRIQ